MEWITKYLTENDCYNDGRYIQVKGLVYHSVGCPQENPEVFFKNFNKPNYSACVHGFVGADKGIITLPIKLEGGKAKRGWHVGQNYLGSYNNTHIGIEATEPSNIRYISGSTFECDDKPKAIEFVKKVNANMIELFADLCKFYNLNPETDIRSHYESWQDGYGSGHGDVDHLFKGLGMDYSMDQFRKDVKNRLDELNNEDDEDMTQEKFNELMNNYLSELAKKGPASWSANERLWAESNKIIKGDENGDMKYKFYCTREDMVVFLKRLYDLTK